jgi:hypothetical protein
MAEGRSIRSLDGLIREIVKYAQPRSAKLVAQDDMEKSFHSLVRLDYTAALSEHFDRRQLGEILAEMRAALPRLNREVFAILDPRRLAQIAAAMGAVLHANAFEGGESKSLRGFYVHDSDLINRPLIGLNTTNHPVAVAATFWHEIGHHLTRKIFGDSHERLELTFNTTYENHLIDPREIAADMLMVLACYPQPAAKRVFGAPRAEVRQTDFETLISRVRPYLSSATGFDFSKEFPALESLHYLAGIVHLAKLRSTLLNEYGI